MDDSIQKLSDVSSRVQLRPQDKESIRQHLHHFISDHPVRVADAERPAVGRGIMRTPWTAGFASFLPQLNSRYMALAVVVVLLLVTSSGVSLAAEQAQPGDVLYGVKTQVNEEVRGWLALDTEAKADWQSELAERRLIEAEQLAVRGQLSNEQQTLLKGRFAKHLDAAQSRIEDLYVKGNVVAATNATSRLESSLQAHAEVLTALTEANIISTTSSAQIMTDLQERLTAVGLIRTQAQAQVATRTEATMALTADAKRVEAERKIASVRRLFGRTNALSVQAQGQAEARLQMADQAVANGRAGLRANLYGEAFTNYDRAERIAREVEVMVLTAHRLKIRLDVNPTAASATTSHVESPQKNNQDARLKIKGTGSASGIMTAETASSNTLNLYFRQRDESGAVEDGEDVTDSESSSTGDDDADNTADRAESGSTRGATDTSGTIDVGPVEVDSGVDVEGSIQLDL